MAWTSAGRLQKPRADCVREVPPGIFAFGLGPFGVYATMPIILGETHWTNEGQGGERVQDATGLRPGLRASITAFSFSKIAVHFTADLRYLVTPETMLITGGTSEPMSYGGWSTGFAFNFVL